MEYKHDGCEASLKSQSSSDSLSPQIWLLGIVRGYSRYAAGTVCRNALHYYNHIARKCRGWSIRCTLINPVHGAGQYRKNASAGSNKRLLTHNTLGGKEFEKINRNIRK